MINEIFSSLNKSLYFFIKETDNPQPNAGNSNNQVIDLLYAFAYVHSRKDTSQGENYDKWLQKYMLKYKLKTF